MLRTFLDKLRFRSFQREIRNMKPTLTKEQYDGLMSMLWQNEGFRNYIYQRENAIIIEMANSQRPPSDQEYQELNGRRKELVDLQTSARVAFNKQNRKIEEKKKSTG